uniref:GB1/RHD3-type G domain-containing protein n=1 Tax=Latimeria chalumnae TaxID=7897 RepID=H3AZM6_LATCH
KMEEPMCLVDVNDDGSLWVNRTTLKTLRDYPQDLNVVAIFGPNSSGKSYLMNRIIGRRKGFRLSHNRSSRTRGMWVWCVPHPIKEDLSLALLDTEGFDEDKGDQKNDCWIFALAVLLSSTLVYNSMGTINEDAVEKLHYVSELTERIKVTSSGNSDDSTEYARFFPGFVWTVRDFTLQLSLEGCPITEDEYLENAIKLRSGHSPKTQAYNLPRECIRNFFPSRKCFVFDRPTSVKEKLQRMEELNENELDQEFVSQARKFCSYVFESTKPKTLKGGHVVTGALFATLTGTYVDTIHKGKVPCLENAVLVLSQMENTAAVEEATSYYQEKMKERVNFPTETFQQLLELHKQCEKETLEIFMRRSFKDETREFQTKLMISVKSNFDQFCKWNGEESMSFCKALLLQLSEQMEERISEGFYFQPRGYQRYREDQAELKEKFKGHPGKGIKADEALDDYLKSKKQEANAILQADQTLSQKDKEIKAERARAEAKELERRKVQESQKIIEQQLRDQERSNKYHIQMLEQKMETERERLLREQERVLEQKLREQRALMEEGHKRKAARLEREIRLLRQEKEDTESPDFLTSAGKQLGSAVLNTVGAVATLGKGIFNFFRSLF